MTDKTQTGGETFGQLAVIGSINLPAPTEIEEGIGNEVDAMIAAIEVEMADLPTDIETEASREKIRKFAYKIARTKTALDKNAKALNDSLRPTINAVNAARNDASEKFEKLQAKARKPLTDYENREKERVNKLQRSFDGLANMRDHIHAEVHYRDMDAAKLRAFKSYFSETYSHADPAIFVSRTDEYAAKFAACIADLDADIEAKQQAEKDAIELAERRAAEEKKRLEDEARAKVQAEADRKAAEQKRIADEAAAKAKAEADAKLAAQKAEADAEKERADKAEADRLQAIADKEAAEKQAEADKIAAAKREREAAELSARQADEAKAQAERDKAAALDAERKRLAAEAEAAASKTRAEADAKAAEDERRAADVEHRRAINAAAMAALINEAKLNRADAQAAIAAIAKGSIPAVKIGY